jgi:hypothetical protein
MEQDIILITQQNKMELHGHMLHIVVLPLGVFLEYIQVLMVMLFILVHIVIFVVVLVEVTGLLMPQEVFM